MSLLDGFEETLRELESCRVPREYHSLCGLHAVSFTPSSQLMVPLCGMVANELSAKLVIAAPEERQRVGMLLDRAQRLRERYLGLLAVEDE